MARYCWLLGCVLALGCSPASKDFRIPSFEDSNAYLIHQSVDNIKLLDFVAPQISTSERVALVSLERDRTKDGAVTSMIEDVFLKQLVDAGYLVLERDDDLLYRLMSESDSAFTYFRPDKKTHTISEGMRGLGSSSLSQSATVTDRVSHELTEGFDNERIATRLQAADKLITYRVVECGILYEDIVGRRAQPDSTTRIAQTRLVIRTEDTKTGRILAVATARGTARDRIPTDVKELLEEFHFRHYGFGYPVIYGNPAGTQYGVENASEKPTADTGKLALGAGILLAIVFTGIAMSN